MRRYVQAMGPFRDNSNYNDFYKFVLLFSPIMRNLKLEICFKSLFPFQHKTSCLWNFKYTSSQNKKY